MLVLESKMYIITLPNRIFKYPRPKIYPIGRIPTALRTSAIKVEL